MEFVAPDAATGGIFGISVGISGSVVVVGAMGDDENSVSSGSNMYLIYLDYW